MQSSSFWNDSERVACGAQQLRCAPGVYRLHYRAIHGAARRERQSPRRTVRRCVSTTGESKTDEFSIQNEKVCIKNEEFCIENDEFCRKTENPRQGLSGQRTIRTNQVRVSTGFRLFLAGFRLVSADFRLISAGFGWFRLIFGWCGRKCSGLGARQPHGRGE